MTLIDLSRGDEDSVYIAKTCYVCKRDFMVLVRSASYERWNQGTLIQNAFPDLSPAEREMIKTGYHPECFDSLFPPQYPPVPEGCRREWDDDGAYYDLREDDSDDPTSVFAQAAVLDNLPLLEDGEGWPK